MKTSNLIIPGLAGVILFFSCEEKVQSPTENKPPETEIVSYYIHPQPEIDSLSTETNSYKVTVTWGGSDSDGKILYYEFSTNGMYYDSTKNMQHDFVFNFEAASNSHKVWVRAVDNSNEADRSPATVLITRLTGDIETTITKGPPSGTEVSSAIRFEISAMSEAETISEILYNIDDNDWVAVSADPSGETIIDITGLDIGVRNIKFKARSISGRVEDTPVSILLFVLDKFTPKLKNESIIGDGGGWFAEIELELKWRASAAHYYGVLPDLPYSYEYRYERLDPLVPLNYNTDPNDALASGWTADTCTIVIPPAGSHCFYLKVRDLAGAVDTMRIRFAAARIPVSGILLVSDIPHPLPALYQEKLLNKAYWDSDLHIDFWDNYGTMASPSIQLPDDIDYQGGGAAFPLYAMVMFTTVIWLADGDDSYWKTINIDNYLDARGNVILATTEGEKFLNEDLLARLNISFPQSGSGYDTAKILEYKSIFPGLIDFGSPFLATMDQTSLFYTEHFKSDSNMTNDDITNWNQTRGFTKADGTTTLLYAHRSSEVLGGFSSVMGLGVWSHPKSVFSDLTKVELPTSSFNGNFIFISGRHYGFDDEACRTNFEYILRNLCREF